MQALFSVYIYETTTWKATMRSYGLEQVNVEIVTDFRLLPDGSLRVKLR